MRIAPPIWRAFQAVRMVMSFVDRMPRNAPGKIPQAALRKHFDNAATADIRGVRGLPASKT